MTSTAALAALSQRCLFSLSSTASTSECVLRHAAGPRRLASTLGQQLTAQRPTPVAEASSAERPASSRRPDSVTDSRMRAWDVMADSALTRHLVNMPPGPEKHLFNLARRSGADLTATEHRYFMQEMRVRTYPELRDEERLYPEGVLEDTQLELMRRHNLTMPCKKNQRIYGTVYAVSKQRVWVDVGHTALAILSRKELSVSSLVSGVVPVTERDSDQDVRRGDTYIFRIQELKCPIGSIWVVPHRPDADTMRERVWSEIERAAASKHGIRGRVLNPISDGFAVGVAGFVARLPLQQADPRKVQRVGALQDFVITSVQTRPRRITLAHPGLERTEPRGDSVIRQARLRATTPGEGGFGPLR